MTSKAMYRSRGGVLAVHCGRADRGRNEGEDVIATAQSVSVADGMGPPVITSQRWSHQSSRL
eukprot:CAMPEP_0198694888 /NCGR_PEP_ID=MMETSP1468-20131203/278092_1 /TAXON_ID=1461545 /ORGANISM="Mantoniella sp, Strain CCMP1436" /LENGTH=61 /DNA_ID=CAMNT_0044450327 /DNA_START=198 /DNA_END=380 /DNA_ORIENTATION=-